MTRGRPSRSSFTEKKYDVSEIRNLSHDNELIHKEVSFNYKSTVSDRVKQGRSDKKSVINNEKKYMTEVQNMELKVPLPFSRRNLHSTPQLDATLPKNIFFAPIFIQSFEKKDNK